MKSRLLSPKLQNSASEKISRSRKFPIKPAAVLSLVMLTGLIQAGPALAQERQLRTLTVTGRGEEKVQTSLAQVRLGVEVQGKTAQEVQQAVAQRSNAVVELLRSRNVENLETTGISLNPNYNYQEGRPPVITSYTGRNIVSFRVPANRAGVLLDEAVRAGATRIDGISFTAPDQTLKTAQQQAIREAIQDAQAQARAALDTLNLTPAEVISIQINGAAPPPRPFFNQTTRLQAEAAPQPTPVIPGEQEIQASATLEIRY